MEHKSTHDVLLLDNKPEDTNSSFGGARKYVHTLVSDLILSGFDVTYAVNVTSNTQEFCNHLAKLGAKIEPIPLVGLDIEKDIRTIDRLLSNINPSICHVNGVQAMKWMLLGSSSFRKGPWKRIFTMHLPIASIAFNGRFNWRKHAPCSWQWRTLRVDGRFVGMFDRIISVSKRHAEVLRNVLKYPPEKIVTIPNGVDTTFFRPVSNKNQRSHLLVGSAGNMLKVKRFDILIEAIAAVRRRVPVLLHIAGNGPEEETLRKQAADLGIADIVDLRGPQADMVKFLQSLDIFVMTSDSEALPYAQLEAMATGLPSVVTSVGDLSLVVRDGQDGYVVPPRSPSVVADRIVRLIQDGSLRNTMASNARARACRIYSQHRASTETIKVFQSLIPKVACKAV